MHKYIKLRQRLIAADADQSDIARILKRSIPYVSLRFTGKYPWDADEMAQIGAWLQIPHEEFYDYFIRPWLGKEREALQ